MFFPGRKEEELYRTQLAKQEQREHSLVLENTKLKQLLNQVSQDVQQLLGMDVGLSQVRDVGEGVPGCYFYLTSSAL